MRALLAVLALFAAACGTSDSRAGGAASLHPAGVAPSDSELVSFLAWQRDLMQLVNRHRAEQDAETQRIVARSPQVGAARIEHDPGLLALVARQRVEAAALQARMPHGPASYALGATLAALGQMTADANGRMVFVAQRDEAALGAARARFGDAFVDWMLAHEPMIDETLSADQ